MIQGGLGETYQNGENIPPGWIWGGYPCFGASAEENQLPEPGGGGNGRWGDGAAPGTALTAARPRDYTSPS